MMRQRGQTLVALALLLPLVLLPVLAYAVQSTLLATRASRLQAAAARAAEDAAAAIDIATLRAGGGLQLDPLAAAGLARASLAAQDQQAVLDSVTVGSAVVTVAAHDQVEAGFGALLGAGAATLRASATSRITAGYSSPNSLIPFPNRSLSMTG